MIPRPPRSTLFPTRRSSDLLIDRFAVEHEHAAVRQRHFDLAVDHFGMGVGEIDRDAQGDRKSTRLNSSHLGISYAVFCLKKKKRKRQSNHRNKQKCNTITTR